MVQPLGVLSLNPLRSVVDASLATQAPISGLVDETGVKDREKTRQIWKATTAENIRHQQWDFSYSEISASCCKVIPISS